MEALLRKISKPALWDKDDLPWLGADDFPSRVFEDLRFVKNELSFYKWDGSETMRDRIVAAMACLLPKVARFSYVLISETDLQNQGLKTDHSSEGAVKDRGIAARHVNIIELGATDAVKAGLIVYKAFEAELVELEEDEVLTCIRFSKDNKYLKEIPKDILQRLI